MAAVVIPETPDGSSRRVPAVAARRRSSRPTTVNQTLASEMFSRCRISRLEETPDSSIGDKEACSPHLIDESAVMVSGKKPRHHAASSQMAKRAALLGILASSPEVPEKAPSSSALFSRYPTNYEQDFFVELAAGTQSEEPAKAFTALGDEADQDSFGLPSRKRLRRSLKSCTVQALTDCLLRKEQDLQPHLGKQPQPGRQRQRSGISRSSVRLRCDVDSASAACPDLSGQESPQAVESHPADPTEDVQKVSLQPEADDRERLQSLMKGVVAFVDVRAEYENRSDCVKDRLLKLGAKVMPRMGRSVTHVVFKDGTRYTYNRAKQLNCHIVSVLWIEACVEQNRLVSETGYPSLSKDRYDSPLFVPKLTRNMVPKSEEQLEKLLQAKLKRQRKKAMLSEASPQVPGSHSRCDTTPTVRRKSILEELQRYVTPVRSVAPSEASNKTRSPWSNEDLDTPLMARIARRLFSNAGDATPSSAVGSISKHQSKREDLVDEPQTTPEHRATEERQSDCSYTKPESEKENQDADVAGIAPQVAVRKAKTRKLLRLKQSLLAESTVALPSPESKAPEPMVEEQVEMPKEGTVLAKKQETVLPTGARRSTLDFVCKEDRKSRRRVKCGPKEMVCTSFSAEDQDMARQLVSHLGRFVLKDKVSANTSHVVLSDTDRRTLNLLRGIIHGCWIVSKLWLLHSMEKNMWVSEEPYEVVSFSKAVQARRIEREVFFSHNVDSAERRYRSHLLASIGPIYIGTGNKVPVEELKELVELSGGHVSASRRKAALIIGSCSGARNAVRVSDKWLLDSIQHHLLQPFPHS